LTRSIRITRRKFASISTAAALLLPKVTAFADAISSANIVNEGGMANGANFKKRGPYRIGFSNGFSGNTWRTEMLASLNAEAKRHPDIKDLIIVDGQGDITKQVNDIQNLAAQDVDAILCIANSGTAVVPTLARASREGIITVPFNLPVAGAEWTTFVGTDPTKKGHALGKWLRDTLAGEGKIVALGGIPGNSYTSAAWAGAKAALAGSNIEVLAFRDAMWQEDKAKVVTADLIAAYPEIDGVWADGGQDAAGAVLALLAAGRPLCPVTGDDFNGLIKLYAKYKASQPKFDIGLMSDPTWESVVALRAALTLLRGGAVAKRMIITPRLITKANYTSYIKPNLPDGVFVDTDLSDAELEKLFG
jgi:ribose transport system substrate-binding protein